MPTAEDADPPAPTGESTHRRPSPRPSGVRIFVVGLVLWAATVLVTLATENSTAGVGS